MINLSLLQCSNNEFSNRYSEAKVIQTSKEGDKLAQKGIFKFSGISDSKIPRINILPNQQFQKIIGFGGAFTESSAFVLNQLSKTKRDEILKAYFHPNGAAYSLTRTHINSCDFSLSNYAYANVPGDVELKHFSIKEDMDDLIPLIKDAMAIKGAEFKIIASPWTAPPWMKDNNDWNDGALKPEYYKTWALYFSKYIKAYAEQGINIWAITVENEPLGNGANWESMIFSPSTMAAFIKDHLGPQLEKDKIEAKILIYDQNRDHLEEWAVGLLSDPDVAKYTWGTAVHWYSSTMEWYPEVLNKVHNRFPTKHLLHTEGCIDAEVPVWHNDEWYWSKEATDWGYDWAPEQEKPLHPKYVPVYRYACDIIGGLNSWLIGWVDWNIVLDEKGGPNHANNWCIAPVIAKPQTGEVYYTPLYYIMSHFSKFIRPEALRIGVDSEIKNLMVTACMNLDGSIVVQILNQKDGSASYRIRLNTKETTSTISGNALQTVVIQ
jgi:glucosylceramidase